MEREDIRLEEQLNTRPQMKRKPQEAVHKRPLDSELEELRPVKKARPVGESAQATVRKVRPEGESSSAPVKKVRPRVAEDGTPLPPKKKRPRPEGTTAGTVAERPVKKVRSEGDAVQIPVKKVRPEGEIASTAVKKVRPRVAEDGTPLPPKKKRPRPEGTTAGTVAERPVKKVRPEGENAPTAVKKVRPEGENVQPPVKKVRPRVAEDGTPLPPKKKRPRPQKNLEEFPVRKTQPTPTPTKQKQPEKRVIPKETEPKRTSVQRKKVREKKTFKKAFLTTFIIFSAILVAALICLWIFLSSFEKSRPEHYAQTIIENIENGKYEDLHLVTADGLPMDDESIMADRTAIGDIIETKVNSSETTYRRLSAESDGEKNVYLVKTGDEKLLKVEMVKAGKKFNFGFSGWEESKTVLLSNDLQPKTIKAQIPATAKLYINGTEISETYITDGSSEIELLNNLRYWEIIGEQPKVATYSVSGIWMNPEITYTADGSEPVICVLQNDLYTAGFEADSDFVDEVYDRVIDCMEPYAYYFSGDAGRDAIANIMLDDSPAYDNATSADVSWMQEHSDVQLTEKTAENFRYYSDGVFSCDIRFLETIYQDEEAVKTWDTNMTWIFVQDGEEYYLADFITNVGD
ncbi:MAG: hypothetical protein MJ086_00140 [Lachnospiraceae bacterium]|nr:hypothetical protein [Lachnospiraceae bacterium]